MSSMNWYSIGLFLVGAVAVALVALVILQARKQRRTRADLETERNKLELALEQNETAQMDLVHVKAPLSRILGQRTFTTPERFPVDASAYYTPAGDFTGDFLRVTAVAPDRVAIIAGDAAGHGIEATMMGLVAVTVFDEWCANSTAGGALVHLARRVNESIESSMFHGRFVAFTACILDTRTGDLEMISMGGVATFWYQAARGTLAGVESSNVPAAGVFPWKMLEIHGHPRPQHFRLAVGDLLCFHSEGLEDSRRDWHGPKMLDERGRESPAEFFSVERIRGVIASVMKRGSWTLARSRTAGEPGDLSFDFSGCAGTAEDTVIALAAAEKVFRLVPFRSGSETTMVEVDPPVDRFLQGHFRHYGEFFGVPVAGAEGSRRFAGLREDLLLDDILILAVRRIEPQAPEPKRVIRLQDEEPTEVLPLTDEEGFEEIPADDVEEIEELPGGDDDEGELLPV